MIGSTAEGQQRQLPVHIQHHHHDAQEREEIPEDRYHPGREEVVQHIHVGGHPGHQAAHGVAIEKGHFQPLQVQEDLLAQVVHHLLPHQLHGERLREFQQEADQHGGKEERESNLGNAHHGIAAEKMREDGRKVLAAGGIQVAVHFHFHQVGRDGLKHSVKERGDEREQRHPPIRTKVLDQSPHQPRVVSLTDDFVFLVSGGHNS